MVVHFILRNIFGPDMDVECKTPSWVKMDVSKIESLSAEAIWLRMSGVEIYLLSTSILIMSLPSFCIQSQGGTPILSSRSWKHGVVSLLTIFQRGRVTVHVHYRWSHKWTDYAAWNNSISYLGYTGLQRRHRISQRPGNRKSFTGIGKRLSSLQNAVVYFWRSRIQGWLDWQMRDRRFRMVEV